MRIIFILFTSVLLSCKNDQQKTTAPTSALAIDSSAKKDPPSQSKELAEDTLVADTGQTWFKVSVTRNDTPFISFEGTWPVLLTTEGFATLGLTASRGALTVSNGLTLYMPGLFEGRLPVVRTTRTKEEVSMIMVPVVNGSYGLAIAPDTGFIEITKKDGKIISGHFDAHSTNEYEYKYRFKGQFLNVKPH